MSDPLIITNTAGSLGDWLSLTPLLRAKPGFTVLAPDAPHTRLFAAVYDGLANVEFTHERVSATPESNEDVCFAQRILNHYGVDVSPIPSIAITAAEEEWARDFLKDYPNPIVFNPTSAAARFDKPYSDICNYRRLPVALVLNVIETLKAAKRTILKFGTKTIQSNIYSNWEHFDGVIDVPDLNLRQLAACYKVIGEYIGTHSGDEHLMLAVGGQCKVLVPPSTWHFNHKRVLYLKETGAWKHEPVRSVYMTYDRPEATITPVKKYDDLIIRP